MEIIFGIVRWVVIIALLGVVLFRIFRIIRPFETGLVERLGKFNREAKSGLNKGSVSLIERLNQA